MRMAGLVGKRDVALPAGRDDLGDPLDATIEEIDLAAADS